MIETSLNLINNSIYNIILTDWRMADAKNYCRVPLGDYGGKFRWLTNPWCLYKDSNGNYAQEICNVTYCGKALAVIH